MEVTPLMSFNEQDRVSAQLHGHGWHRLAPPRTVQCYVAGIWLEAPVTEINNETREIRIEYPTVTSGVRRLILDGSQYRPSEGLFPAREGGSVSTGPTTGSATSAAMGGLGSQS
jgi:hypothetical protein